MAVKKFRSVCGMSIPLSKAAAAIKLNRALPPKRSLLLHPLLLNNKMEKKPSTRNSANGSARQKHAQQLKSF